MSQMRTALAFVSLWLVSAFAAPPPPADLQRLEARNAELTGTIHHLQSAGKPADLINDVAVYNKAADWLLRYPEEFYQPDYLAKAMTDVEHGLARAAELSRWK